ncbi:hypothetical protein CAOG_08149 [Capsaspora owczarzaki ATCC 30864]|uniref:ENTH domain-containing protein n=1 Tax=Capsaspora owczarzaki (strain ATCC 30864) TaxID=595528 RepID=A0A0D2WXV3_CAPO3|nr:hypothetical protein CAOG_08149 [Capsaspora owczarzaki ATCC 30864]KJE98135.1 hypothetical protein CAOG_008149 [Capsaspora owczarzaki ATCC 30864]|eukprot:XP_004342750.2 hypothetical protein CAOG_08149 [Capsaspora owczarzaki ATCC 30864]
MALEQLKSSAMGKLALAVQLPMLNKATANDEVPTPGYMFAEIAKISFESVQLCGELEDYLMRKLDKPHCFVKLKALRILAYLIDKGNPTIKRDLMQRTNALRAAAQFRGPPDFMLGDSQYAAVRAAAAELLEVLFASVDEAMTGGVPKTVADQAGPRPQRSSGAASGGSSYIGMGSNSAPVRQSSNPNGSAVYSSSGVGYAVQHPTSKYMGISSQPVNTQQKETSFLDKVMDTINNLADSLPDPQPPNRASGGYNTGPSHFGAGTTGRVYAPPASEQLYSRNDVQTYGVSTPVVESNITPLSGSPSLSVHEARLVEEITAAGGVRVAPPREALAQFIKRCSSLDCHRVAQLLGEKLDSPSWQVRLKALFVVEALLQSDIIAITECIAPLAPVLEQQQDHAQQQVRDKAAKVLLMLGGETPVPTASGSSFAATMGAPAPSGNSLLDLGELSLGAAPAGATVPASGGGGSAFSFMADAAPEVAPVATSVSSTTQPSGSANPAVSNTASSSSLFSGMKLGSKPPTASAVAAPATSSSSSAIDLFGDASSPSQATSLLDTLDPMAKGYHASTGAMNATSLSGLPSAPPAPSVPQQRASLPVSQFTQQPAVVASSVDDLGFAPSQRPQLPANLFDANAHARASSDNFDPFAGMGNTSSTSSGPGMTLADLAAAPSALVPMANSGISGMGRQPMMTTLSSMPSPNYGGGNLHSHPSYVVQAHGQVVYAPAGAAAPPTNRPVGPRSSATGGFSFIDKPNADSFNFVQDTVQQLQPDQSKRC